MPKLWPFIPATVSEVLEFGTDVRRARDGEFRDSLKDATQKLTFNYTMLDAEAARAEGLFRSQITGEWFVPLWHDATFTDEGISAGQDFLMVEDFADYRVSGKAAIIKGDQEWEVVDVATYSSGQITLSGTVSASYSGLVAIVPLVTGIAPSGLQRGHHAAYVTISIAFVLTQPADLAADDLPNFGSYDVLPDPSVVMSALDGSLSQALDFIDNGFGAYALETIETFSRWRGTIGFADYTVTDRWDRRQFLHRIRGKDRPFWLPTWKDDLALISGALSGSNQLVVNEVTDTPADLIGRAIQIDLGLTQIYRTITAASAGVNSITITLNTTHGQAITTSMDVSFMHLVRFDSDTFDITHRRTGDGFLSSFQAPVVEVPG